MYPGIRLRAPPLPVEPPLLSHAVIFCLYFPAGLVTMNQVCAFVVLCLVATVNGFVAQAPASLSRGQFVSRTATSQVRCWSVFFHVDSVVVMKNDRGSPLTTPALPRPETGKQLPFFGCGSLSVALHLC